MALSGCCGFDSATQALLMAGAWAQSVELMRRHRNRRAGQEGVERLPRGIHLSINSIAAGLRNTG